jgi:hypothetical protein
MKMRSVWEIAEAGKDIGGKCGLTPNLIRKAPYATNRDSARVTALPPDERQWLSPTDWLIFATGLRPLEA